MPGYEMLVIVKKLGKAEMTATLKRMANFILDNNCVLRNIENLGERELHMRQSNPIPNSRRFNSGNFFLYHFDSSPGMAKKIHEDVFQDNDTIRAHYCKKEPKLPPGYRCTLEDELKPPAIRESVKILIEKGRKKRPEFDMGSFGARQIL